MERREEEIRPPAACWREARGRNQSGGFGEEERRWGFIMVGWGRGTVSATEMVSWRDLSRVDNSDMSGRREEGGNEEEEVMFLNACDGLGSGGRRGYRRIAQDEAKEERGGVQLKKEANCTLAYTFQSGESSC